MPSRWLSLAIIAFWLGTNGWLFYHDIWPTLRPNQPPPMTIDIVQEARRSEEIIPWAVTQNGRPVFAAKTSIRRLGPDEFELVAEYRRRRDHVPAIIVWCAVARMHSSYRVTSNGNLLALGVTMDGELRLRGVGPVSASIEGEVRSGQLTP